MTSFIERIGRRLRLRRDITAKDGEPHRASDASTLGTELPTGPSWTRPDVSNGTTSPRLRQADAPTDEGDGRTSASSSGNPYLAHRHEFHNRFYDLAKAKRNWQIATFLALGALLVLTAGYVHMASRSQVTPYIVEVDQLGTPRVFGPATPLPPHQLDRAISAELGTFIGNVRRVIGDPDAQRAALLEAYAFLDGDARTFLNAHFEEAANDPRVLSQTVRRAVRIESILRLPDSNSYNVRWTEMTRSYRSGDTQTTAWEAVLIVRVDPPRREDLLLQNPLGIYVTDINWTRITSDTPSSPRRP